MKIKSLCLLCLLGVTIPPSPAHAADEIPVQRAKQIYSAAPASARVAPKKPRRVLVWITPAHLMEKDPHKGYCIPYGASAFETLGRKSGAYVSVVSGELSLLLPESIQQFDAIVMNNSSGPWITPTDADMTKPEFKRHGEDKGVVENILRKSLMDFVSNGGGIVACHYAIGANRHWPEFHELLGATFIGHPWNEEVAIQAEEPDHPLLAAFAGKNFRLADEIFHFGPPFDRRKLRVLLSLDTERTNMGVRWIHRTDNDFAQAWIKSHGQGRVFYTGFGHRTEVWWNPAILQFFLDAIQFATGDLEAPTAPRDSRPTHRAPGPTSPEVRLAKMQAKNVVSPTGEQIRNIEIATPNSAPAKPIKRRKVLVWGHSWTHPPNPVAETALEVLGRKTEAFEATVSDDPRLLLGDRLPQFDALVMNNIHERDPFLPEELSTLDPEQQTAARKFDVAAKQSILEYVRSGKGVAGIHAATAAFQNWPEYGEMMGGYYGSHLFEDVVIRPEDSAHPLNACFGGKPWRIKDEVYVFRPPYSRQNVRVLLSLDLGQMKDPGKRPDRDYPVSWIREYGKGRVFYVTVGHASETYWNPLFLSHVLAGIQFATGDLAADAAPHPRISDDTEAGFISLFNGKDLSGWEGDRRYWSVRDGAINGQTTPDNRVAENNFLVWQGGQPRNFELHLKFKLVGGNSGIYFHSEKRAPGEKGEALVGPQADFSGDHRWTGVLMEYTKREILAERGQRVVIDEAGRKLVTGTLGDPGELLKAVKDRAWNDYTVTARGESVVLKINGVTMCEVTDRDPRRTPAGYLALQVHTGPPMTVQFKDIRMRQY